MLSEGIAERGQMQVISWIGKGIEQIPSWTPSKEKLNEGVPLGSQSQCCRCPRGAETCAADSSPTISRESRVILAKATLSTRALNSSDETGLETKALLPTPWKPIYSCEMHLTVNESGCTTVKAAFWNDKEIRLAFGVFLTDANCSSA